MGNRFFSEKEIEKWNGILQKMNYKYTISIDNNSHKLIFIDKWDTSLLSTGRKENDAEMLKNFMSPQYSQFQYNFSFSVIKKRKDDFFNIVSSFITQGFEIGGYDTSKYFDIRQEATERTGHFLEVEHTVYNNEMVRITYIWKNPLIAMMVSTIIEDAIKFFEIMWEYTEDGEEKCLIKYPIGSIVSRKGNKGIDYMVNSYEFVRPNTYITYNASKPYLGTDMIAIDKPTILYDITCIESDIKSSVIRYGESCIVSEEDIGPSRTNSLNIILN